MPRGFQTWRIDGVQLSVLSSLVPRKAANLTRRPEWMRTGGAQAERLTLCPELGEHFFAPDFFAIHNAIGRFFDERIYKFELAQRLTNVRLKEPVEVKFASFRTTYALDVLVADGALFEFKAAESLVDRHRAQLLNYLLLCDLAHGKLINVRTTTLTR